jgi:hypothetical protein
LKREIPMAEIFNFKGDIFWVEADPENSVDDPDDELDNAGEGSIVQFEQAVRLPNFFGVLINGKSRYFDTELEALDALVKK